ncbi:hypothetical protein Pfo_007309 [Paulownia fortunei]|nr:hypothetical protein Pfo_007309 [Paulownia fortunei]
MNPTSILICRRLLQAADVGTFVGIPDASIPPITAAVRRPFNSTTPFDSSVALTFVILITAFFFLGFFSIYIRHFTAAEEDPSPPSSDSRPRPPPPNHKGGLDTSAVNSLPLLAYGKAAKHTMIDDCPICLSEFHERETVKLIPYCSHVFHPSCIDTWLASHVTCPLCRSRQLFKSVEGVSLDVTHDKNDNGASDNGDRLTVEDGDT